MSHLVLIRHGDTVEGRTSLLGRRSGAHLSAAGRAQAERLARDLAPRRFAAVYSSPQARARETAQLLAQGLFCPLQIESELDEIDYGDWSGLSFEELRGVADWRAFNVVRSWSRIPNGEFMPEVQARVTGLLQRLATLHGGSWVALVSHADVIRAALAYCLGMPLDLSLRLEVATASVSIVALDDHEPRVVCVNNGGAPRDDLV